LKKWLVLHWQHINLLTTEVIMAKGQQKSNKESRKPKKDSSPPKPMSGGEPMRAAITTAVLPKGKEKKKLG
jgi:hypothetical protein